MHILRYLPIGASRKTGGKTKFMCTALKLLFPSPIKRDQLRLLIQNSITLETAVNAQEKSFRSSPPGLGGYYFKAALHGRYINDVEDYYKIYPSTAKHVM
jgi:hypothetical protein